MTKTRQLARSLCTQAEALSRSGSDMCTNRDILSDNTEKTLSEVLCRSPRVARRRLSEEDVWPENWGGGAMKTAVDKWHFVGMSSR